jgi:hypothetical protein
MSVTANRLGPAAEMKKRREESLRKGRERLALRIAEHEGARPRDDLTKNRNALVCADCGQDVGDSVFWWHQNTLVRYDSRKSVFAACRPQCRACYLVATNEHKKASRDWYARLSGDPDNSPVGDLLEPDFDPFEEHPYVTDWCENCDRVVTRVGGQRRGKRAACSPECDESLRKALRNAARQVPRANLRCAVCRNEFTPNRADARYCTNACRQDAYRKRKLGAA